MCLHLHLRCVWSLRVLPIAELVQRLSSGLLIPFYSTGIMCYSNPNPIWGVWRWHEDDVTARTRGGTEISLHESRLQLAALLRTHQIIAVICGGDTNVLEGGGSVALCFVSAVQFRLAVCFA